jgi:hypothetical protein
MSRRKLTAFAVITVSGVVALTIGVLFALDLYAHSRVQRSAGVNRPGYRGLVAADKPAGAERVVMPGASTVFGWDVAVDDPVPGRWATRLERLHGATPGPDGAAATTRFAAGAVDLPDRQLAFDGMHLNADGNTIIARVLIDSVSEAGVLTGPRP